MLLSPCGGSHALLVFLLEIGALVDQELDDVILVLLDGVVNGSLVLRVSVVKLGAKVNQMLSGADMTLPDGVIDGGLSILILSIDVIFALVHEEADGL